MGDRQGHAHPVATQADNVDLGSEKLGQGIGAWLRYAEQRAPQLLETRVHGAPIDHLLAGDL